MASLGVVVPAYRPDVDQLNSYVTALDERLTPVRILIELDAPRPGVVEALEGGPATISVSPDRRGKGRAIAAGFDRLVAEGLGESDRRPDDGANGGLDDERTGGNRSGGDHGGGSEGSESGGVLAFFDADASTPPESAAAVVSPVVAGEKSVTVGSRRHPEASVGRHQTLGRRRLGDAFAWCARRVVEPSLFDYQCGAKALSTTVWTDVRRHLSDPGFGWDLELVVLTAALGYDIREIPIAWDDSPRSTVPPVRTALALARSLYVARRRAVRLDSRSSVRVDNARPCSESSGNENERDRSREGHHLEERNAGR